MTDIKAIFQSMMVLGLLIFSLMSFIIIFQEDNSVEERNKITNNTLINDSYGGLYSNLSSSQSSTEDALNSLEDVPPEEYVGDLNVGSTVSTTRNARAVISGLWNIYVKLPMVILGVDQVVAATVTSIILLLIAIGVWALWKGAIS